MCMSMSTVCVTAARVAHLNLPLKCVSAPVALSLSVTPLQSSSHYELIFLCFHTRTVLNNASYPRSEWRRTTCVLKKLRMNVNQEFCSKPCFHLRGVYCVWLQSQWGLQSSINLWECRSPSMLITAIEVSSVCSQLWTSLGVQRETENRWRVEIMLKSFFLFVSSCFCK